MSTVILLAQARAEPLLLPSWTPWHPFRGPSAFPRPRSWSQPPPPSGRCSEAAQVSTRRGSAEVSEGAVRGGLIASVPRTRVRPGKTHQLGFRGVRKHRLRQFGAGVWCWTGQPQARRRMAFSAEGPSCDEPHSLWSTRRMGGMENLPKPPLDSRLWMRSFARHWSQRPYVVPSCPADSRAGT